MQKNATAAKKPAKKTAAKKRKGASEAHPHYPGAHMGLASQMSEGDQIFQVQGGGMMVLSGGGGGYIVIPTGEEQITPQYLLANPALEEQLNNLEDLFHEGAEEGAEGAEVDFIFASTCSIVSRHAHALALTLTAGSRGQCIYTCMYTS